MSRTKVELEPKVSPVQLTAKQLEMAVYGLKIWRQVIVASAFAEMRDGSPIPYQETLTEIDLTLEKFDQAKGK